MDPWFRGSGLGVQESSIARLTHEVHNDDRKTGVVKATTLNRRSKNEKGEGSQDKYDKNEPTKSQDLQTAMDGESPA